MLGIPIGITCSAIGLKSYAVSAWINKSIIKKKKKIYDQLVLLAKELTALTELNSMEVLISNALIDSYISHDEFVSVDNGLKDYYDMKKKSEI